MDRRAIVIGCYENLRPPSAQKTRGLVDRMARALGGSIVGCRSLSGGDDEPTKLVNPSYADIVQEIENISKPPTQDTELYLYYVGHSVPSHENDLSISVGQRSQIQGSLSNDTEIEMRPIRLNKILEDFAERGFRRIIAIFDTCHSGRAVHAMNGVFPHHVVMTSTGSAYSYNAEFTEALIHTLERPLHARDQRVDRALRGITFNRLFRVAKARLPNERLAGQANEPRIYGDMQDAVVFEVPVDIPARFNPQAAKRSIYHRLFEILKLLSGKSLTERALYKLTESSRTFLLSGEDRRFVSEERVAEYVAFLVGAGLAIAEGGRIRLSQKGELAAADLFYNEALLDAIESTLFPDDLDYEILDDAIRSLIDDRLQATPANLSERLRMSGIVLTLNDATRFAFKLLPSTKRFGRGSSDALQLMNVD